VCNHPDLFEPRPIISPFHCEDLLYHVSTLVAGTWQSFIRADACPFNFWAVSFDESTKQTLSELCAREPKEVFIDDVCLDDLPERLLSRKYQQFVRDYREKAMQHINSRYAHCFALSSSRCDSIREKTFAISWRTVQACHVPPSVTEATALTRCSNNNRPEGMTVGVANRLAMDMPLCWRELVRTNEERSNDMTETISRFVFVLPKCFSTGPRLITSKVTSGFVYPMLQRKFNDLNSATRQAVSTALRVYYPSFIRQRIFFPDRKLVQFDSGKLQTLCRLLRRLKKGGHKCLIFTQMSKMLDILETFLNLHGHTYVRLDGSTGVEKRQKLMDRFNNDPKIFCFILSTRSGGLGINLTGADSVIFYDSDWNPVGFLQFTTDVI
jgi:SNF2 family DNA or RNA helicase